MAAQNKDFIREENLRSIEKLLQKAVRLGKENDISLQQITDLLQIFYEEEQ